MKKRVLSSIIAFSLIIGILLGNYQSVSAASGDSLTATKGVYYFDTHELGEDLTDTFIYDDSLLLGDSLKYNQSLATMSFELAVASISSEREPKTEEGYANKSRNLKAYLEDNGFIDFDTNQFYKEKMTTDTFGVACAHKKIEDNGKTYTLLVIAPRSAGYESEWGGNFEMGLSGDHAGFKKGRQYVLDFAKEYIAKYGITGDIKVWTAGYSRGAGVTNQVGAALIYDANAALGDSVNLTPENLYCYTFGTPNSAGYPNADFGDPTDSKFDYIHNTWEAYDIVTIAPPAGFGFARYGKDYTYADRGDKNRMLEMLQVTNPRVYDLYMNGGDPDYFAPKTIDIEKLLTDRTIAIMNDDNPYLPLTQPDYMKLMEDSIVAAVGSREEYVNGNYEVAMKDFCGYFFSHLDKAGVISSELKNNKLATPLVAFMYISYMVERYKDTTFDQGTVDEIKKAITELEEIIAEMEDAGETVPQELKDKLNSLKTTMEDIDITTKSWGNIYDTTRLMTSLLYSYVMGNALYTAGLWDENPDLYNRIISYDESKAMTRIFTYLLLYDESQTDNIISFSQITQQMKHFATFAWNASSFMRPHNNEIILSWLRTLDSNYDDFSKENESQKTGYRRLYISAQDGVTVSGTVKDDSGNAVATFEDGKLLSRTDSNIGITTCDTGNWLRLPLDKTYNVDLKVNEDTVLNLKATEYSVYDNSEVRTETSDEKYDWTKLSVKSDDEITWVISAVSDITIPSSAEYYIDILSTFTISYDLNGGELDGVKGVITKDYKEGTEIELPKPSKEGYEFDYWEGSKYNAGDKYTVTEDHTFTAQWKEIKSDAKPDDKPKPNDNPNKPDNNSGGGDTNRNTEIKSNTPSTGDNTNISLFVWINLISLLFINVLMTIKLKMIIDSRK